MNPLLQQIVIQTVRSSKKKPDVPQKNNKYQEAKAFYHFKAILKGETVNLFLIISGVFAAGFGLKSFLLPNNFIDGGVTGISLLISEVTGFTLPVLIALLNIPFITIGYSQIGKIFALKTIFAIAGLAVCIAFVNYPVLTVDKLLVSVFGGFFLGAGIGLAMRGGGVIDGTEVMAIYFSKKTGLTIGDIILIVNIIIFSFAAWLLSFETALYSILTYLSASRTVDFILEGIEEHTGVTIISVKNEEIRKMITEVLGRGVTIYKGSRGFGKNGHKPLEIDILYSVISRLEVTKMTIEIEKIDPAAFVIMNRIKDTKGGMIKKRKLH
jgi:uncharacterized membrane-anchored protein YitT (DUF2179 family)